MRDIWFELVFFGGFAVFLAFFPQWVGVGVNRNGVWGFVPALSANFEIYQPWIVAYLLAKMVFNIALARRSYWDTRDAVDRHGDSGGWPCAPVCMMFGPEMFGINPAYMAIHNPSAALRCCGIRASRMEYWIQHLSWIQLAIQFVLLVRDIFRPPGDNVS